MLFCKLKFDMGVERMAHKFNFLHSFQELCQTFLGGVKNQDIFEDRKFFVKKWMLLTAQIKMKNAKNCLFLEKILNHNMITLIAKFWKNIGVIIALHHLLLWQ